MKLMILLASMLSLFGDKNDTITSFSLREDGGMSRFSGFSYSIKETKDGRVNFLFDEGYPDEKEFTLDDHSVFDSLQQIIIRYKMHKYHGHYRPTFNVTDGKSWSLDVRYASGKSISAGGYMDGPSGYRQAFQDIRQCLKHWKELPIAQNEIVSFLYVYGKERYTIERKDNYALLTFDNEETGEHKVFEKNLDMLEDLRIVFNINGLKMNNKRGNTDFECTLWMYEINYSNGDNYRYESYDRDYKCGYTNSLQGFISRWMKE